MLPVFFRQCAFLISFLNVINVVGCQSAIRDSDPTIEQAKQPANRLAVMSVTEEHDELNHKERLAWRQGRKNYLKSLYQERIDPYFGLSDQGASCEARSVKKVDEASEDGATFVTYQILTTDSGATGVCDEKMQTHKMTLVFAACENRSLQFTLKLICSLAQSSQADSCRVSAGQIENYCLYRNLSGVEN
jgi:hypothetical protein